MASKKSKSNSPSFEQSLEVLQRIVAELEHGRLSLSDSLEKYEQGVNSLKSCFAALQAAQRKIEQLIRLDENGRVIGQPFDDNPSHHEQAAGIHESSYRRNPKSVQIDEEIDSDDDGSEGSLF